MCEVWLENGWKKSSDVRKESAVRQRFGPKKNEETNEFERRTNDDLYDLYRLPDIVASKILHSKNWFLHNKFCAPKKSGAASP